MADTVNHVRFPGDIVAYYFSFSYTVKEIAGFRLFIHSKVVSIKTVYRIMKILRLKRYRVESPLISIVQKIIHLHKQGCYDIGKILNSCCGINATQKSVKITLKDIHYDGVVAESRRRLVRRKHCNLGPNFCIHVDGYDKLNSFGISVHGEINSFSIKIIWLSTASHTNKHTNKHPRHVALVFVEYLRQSKCISRD